MQHPQQTQNNFGWKMGDNDDGTNDPVYVPGTVFQTVDAATQKKAAYAVAEAVPAIPVVKSATASASAAAARPASGSPSPTRAQFAQIDESRTRNYLRSHQWPSGLQDLFLTNLALMPIRFFICDDSGSMVASDGHRKVGNDANTKYVDLHSL
jgi:hypothetical protein